MTRTPSIKKIISYGSLILFFVVLALYGIWQARDLLFGIRISISDIKDGQTLTEPVLALSGVAHHAVFVEVNQKQVPVAQDGAWNTSLALGAGHNIIVASARDKFGKTVSKEIRVYYDAPDVPEPLPDVIPSEDVNDSSQEVTEEIQ